MSETLHLPETAWGSAVAFVATLTLRGVLLLTVTWVASRFALRKSSAGLHDCLWRGTFVALLVLPLLALAPGDWWPRLGIEPEEEAPAAVAGRMEMGTPVVRPPRFEGVAAPVAQAVGDGAAETPDRSGVSPSAAKGLALLWAAGFLGVAGRFLLGLRQVRAQERTCRPVADADWRRELASVAAETGVRGRIALLSGPDVPVPYAAGLLRRRIVLPAPALGLGGEERQLLLRHELAHLGRGDLPMRILARLALAIHWANPLVWLAHRCLLAAEERAVDDAVLSFPAVRPLRYAELLAQFASRKVFDASVPAMAQPSTVADRVRRILDPAQRRESPTRRARLLFGACLAALTILCGGVLAQEEREKDERQVKIGEVGKEETISRTFRISSGQWNNAAGAVSALDFLAGKGIEFESGSGAVYDDESAQLVARLPSAEMDKLAAFLAEWFDLLSLRQVLITTKQFVVPISAVQTEGGSGDAALDRILATELNSNTREAIAGVVTDSQYVRMIETLNAQGAKLRSLPSVVTRGGQAAEISVEADGDFQFPTNSVVVKPTLSDDGLSIDLWIHVEPGSSTTVSIWNSQTVVVSIQGDRKNHYLEFVTARIIDANGNSMQSLDIPSAPLRSKFDTVILDAGHGGKDAGTRSREGLVEKHLNLDMARRVRAVLEEQGLKVLLTRTNDELVEKRERAAVASRVGSALLVSIHWNSIRSSKVVRGYETYFLKPTDGLEESGLVKPRQFLGRQLAEAIHAALGQAIGVRSPDRGLLPAGFRVLRDADCPAALVEVGYLSDPEDAALARDEDYLDDVASGIAAGIADFVSASAGPGVSE